MKYTYEQFKVQYPTDDVCLDRLWKQNYGNVTNCPKCHESFIYKRVKDRKCYQCQHTDCQFQIYPMAGTIFEKSTTPLRHWYYAMYLFTTTRNGVAAKELERILPITYPTALRTAHKIKILMGTENIKQLSNIVEMDECLVNGKLSNMHESKKKKMRIAGKTQNKVTVFGMIERKGKAIAKVVPSRDRVDLIPQVKQNIKEGTILITDSHNAYSEIDKLGFYHQKINHEIKQYKEGLAHTNTVEGLWSHLKRMIKGTHIQVSPQHLQKYVDEAVFRYNNRNTPELMFETLISLVA